jgi:teichuronic acid exporter
LIADSRAGTGVAAVEAPARVFTGAGWLALSKLGSQIFSWAGTFYVATRLLPTDYGLSNLSTAFTEFAVILTNMGIGTTLIQRQEVDKEKVDSLFTASLILGAILALIALGLSYFGGWYFKNPALVPLTQFTALIYLLGALTIVPYNFLNRDMRFKERGLLDMYSVLASISVQMVLAALGCGVWTLLWGSVVRFGMRLGLAFRYSGYRPRLGFDWGLMQRDLRFSAQLTLNWLLFIAKERSVPILIGRAYTVAQMGLLGFAGSLSGIPNLKLVQLLREVLLPLLSKRSHDPESQLRGLATALKGMILLVVPIYLCGSHYGEAALSHVLPPKWAPMFPLFEALCLVQMWTVLASIVAIYNTAQGKPSRSTWFDLSMALVVPCVTFALRHLPLIALAHVWASIGGILFAGWFVFLFRRAGAFLGRTFALAATVTAVCCALFAFDTFVLAPSAGGSAAGVLARTGFFCAAYAGYLWAAHGEFLAGLRKK